MNKKLDGFVFKFKRSDQLTKKEIEQKYKLSTCMYPQFKKYYEKNKYYSTIKPQIVLNILHKGVIVGSGKFQWTTTLVSMKKIKLFSFGLLIYPEYQNKGLGSHAIKLNIEKAKKMGADILFGSSSHPAIKKICKRLGFKILKCKVVYTTPEGIKEVYKENCYAYEFEKELIARINSSGMLDIGIGPV